METQLRIKGMSCGHCVKAVEGALKALPEVRGVEVQVGQAKVVSDGPLDRDKVQRALDEEGFSLEA